MEATATVPPFSDDGYNPCWRLQRNYDVTGRVCWLNRYRLCLRQHYAD
jgi:hypothetical protein